MNDSLILRTSAPMLMWLSLAVSLFIVLRGHNAPGGGFLGGLIASAGILIYAIARGRAAAERLMRLDPVAICGAGLLAALASGLPAWLDPGAPYLVHAWWFPGGGLAIGTTILFDLGVYLAVIGTVTAMFLALLPR
ncbi:multisubunit sodium/proton antiporter MrpB subunit [Stella humosa]|uniref:Multisubunit sodium/proton antiporter MrpB subunit n=1 Tax=Stella humosa TaxID=94 RepID=A0A3N1MCA4_9PROT|nr:MnhB domain-containing protein [Stella humosa]ROQ00380.1 multisubunit sodium/proton antiporter MrpB subunit [Stella humosa]BBK30381.1 Na(+)/H(+) antiporter subunit B [Stella humosa]